MPTVSESPAVEALGETLMLPTLPVLVVVTLQIPFVAAVSAADQLRNADTVPVAGSTLAPTCTLDQAMLVM